MKYLVLIEKAPENYAAYVPDLPGCVSVGDTIEEVRANIREAMDIYLDELRASGQLPAP